VVVGQAQLHGERHEEVDDVDLADDERLGEGLPTAHEHRLGACHTAGGEQATLVGREQC
jgi:hypothetical protein